MKVPEKLQLKTINITSFKTLMVVVLIYPILPLGLFSSFFLFYGFGSLLMNGFQHTTFSQIALQFLLFAGGASGLIGGIMVLTNRINVTSFLLFLHGAISYSFVAGIFLDFGTNWKSLWVLHSFYIAITLVVVGFQLCLIVKKVFADYQAAKVVNAKMTEAVSKTGTVTLTEKV